VRARLAVAGWLALVWVVLWENLAVATVLSGLAVGALLLLLFPRREAGRYDVTIRPLRVLVFLGYFVVKLLEANLVVARTVATPGSARINEGIVAVPLLGAPGIVLTLLVNAVSLTPGTLVIEVRREPLTLYVHVLHLRTIEQVRLDILRLERLLLLAVGSAESLRDCEARIAEGVP
jgi:multicomponent Na+:H+ antiporter subunit E